MEGQKILIVEDDADISGLLVKIMEGAGYQVRQAFSGTEALFCMERELPDCVLLDLMLPGMTGEEVLEQIRQEQKKEMPVLILSAKVSVQDKVKLLRLGADDYITKPFNIKEVILRINNLLKRAYDNPSKIQIDGYDIDLEKRRVFYNNNEIILTTKEYDLLVYFLNNKGLAISREQVLSKVWDENYFGSDRVVDDTLRRLRKKMPEINIRTIYGFGYRLD